MALLYSIYVGPPAIAPSTKKLHRRRYLFSVRAGRKMGCVPYELHLPPFKSRVSRSGITINSWLFAEMYFITSFRSKST